MDQLLRAPRNRTAELQLIQRLVSQGYTLWTTDQIPLGKLSGFIQKWARYRFLANPAARAYRKQSGRANSHLILEHRFNALEVADQASERMQWLMVGTRGRDGLGDDQLHPGLVMDADCRDSHLQWMGYELVWQSKHYTTADGQLRQETTWTWRLPSRRYREWEALLIESAKRRDYAALNQSFGVLCGSPMFAGVRAQVLRLRSETNRMLKKMGGAALPSLDLPFMTLLPIWPVKESVGNGAP